MATDLETAHNDKRSLYKAEEKALEDKITTLQSDVLEATEKLRSGEDLYIPLEAAVLLLGDNILTLKTEKTDLETAILVNKDELDKATKAKHDTLKDLDINIELNKQLVQEQKRTLDTLVNQTGQKVAELDSFIAGKQQELTVVTKQTSEQKQYQTEIQADVTLLTEAINTAINKGNIVKAELHQAFADLEEIKVATDANQALLEEAQKQKEVEQAELNVLIAKRIDSVHFMEQLNNREANLKKKYEDVGLDYPQ